MIRLFLESHNTSILSYSKVSTCFWFILFSHYRYIRIVSSYRRPILDIRGQSRLLRFECSTLRHYLIFNVSQSFQRFFWLVLSWPRRYILYLYKPAFDRSERLLRFIMRAMWFKIVKLFFDIIVCPRTKKTIFFDLIIPLKPILFRIECYRFECYFPWSPSYIPTTTTVFEIRINIIDAWPQSLLYHLIQILNLLKSFLARAKKLELSLLRLHPERTHNIFIIVSARPWCLI